MSFTHNHWIRRLQAFCNTALLWSIVFLFLFVPLSRAAASVFGLAICILFLLSGNWVHRFKRLQSNYLTTPLMALCSLLLLGYVYSVGSGQDKLEHLLSYSRFLLIFILIACLDTSEWRSRCWQALSLACILVVASSVLSIWWQLPWGKNLDRGLGGNHAIFANHLWQNVLVSFFVCLCLFKAKFHSTRSGQWTWLLIAAASILSIFFLVQGRTGQLTAVVSIMLLVFIFLKYKQRLITFILTALAFIVIFSSSDVAHQRFEKAANEIHDYTVHKEHNNSSVGLRLHNWNINSKLVFDRLLFGYGSGSYATVAEKAFNDPVVCSTNCTHPHNQFLYFFVENGFFAMLAFVWLLVRLVLLGWRADAHSYEKLALPFTCVLFLHSLVDSPFVVGMDRAFYTSMIGLLAAGTTHFPKPRQMS